MSGLGATPWEVRTRISALVRDRQDALASDLTGELSEITPSLDAARWHDCARLLIRLFAAGIDAGAPDSGSSAVRDLDRYLPPLTIRQLVDAIYRTERVLLDEVALDERLGATSEPWARVAHAIRRAALEIVGAHAEHVAARAAPAAVRDPLTTLIGQPIFALALGQEIERARRHAHALAVLLFDLDDLAAINRDHGWGVGNRILERLGILARQFFRTHDWVARQGDDAIAVLLPETTLAQAHTLASDFQAMVPLRLVVHDHKTGVTKTVTVSAAALGTDLVRGHLDASQILAEAEAAVLRAKAEGQGVVRVALPSAP